MKLQVKPLLLLLPALLAAPAVAQVRVVLPGGNNPYIGAPAYLPGPAVTPLNNMRIDLPAPSLNPGLAISLAPTPNAAVAIMGVFPVLPIPMIPSRPIVPVIRPEATRENVAHPLAPILPGLGAQFAANDRTVNGEPVKVRRDALDNLFDGGRKPAPQPSPVRPSRRVTLPESDLEHEIGAY